MGGTAQWNYADLPEANLIEEIKTCVDHDRCPLGFCGDSYRGRATWLRIMPGSVELVRRYLLWPGEAAVIALSIDSAIM
jgi:hypothetical protein